ncbi:hypothetical protein A3F00_04545 [Candidatus Daviesbacteria bacterium RIFCSPHIGHO2_12_FULL_37_11]|uniref:HTH merR-type domain-containing protein n=1 Tax=Candidatus Daviesbacteria bacterium RIFCSPHIGHO2_12_FULL_37_11 TaxID=1797777 RepID=A0A1F5K9Q5_9BACT|nr:MAG: hypothetical protein A2111_00360 [Candidatus Daviesbacteria bacterium GWA1_38_6]OGE16170.1 MAG: hypothetical protein A2769_03715 [Candidatus Daviesbacteria bacterium RIFCSPHIGHO2_01_FULL_37_27]OGE37693.1 MAG: hypothetical protein A3F00_04545 [Candidatus Daviesbacteria bacterium RIFCSPHIGHO2_12_FULL_37_11]OGE46349.1 MAG: hypothetical protein A3B39_00465 [Candidatus Daviesbacteria bacterium RIFCSPLOWO2_01_FULL_37_10]
MVGIEQRQQYVPVELVEWLGISRTTLFRWDGVEVSSSQRDCNGNRFYTRETAVEIANKVVSKNRMSGDLSVIGKRFTSEEITLRMGRFMLASYFIDPLACLMSFENLVSVSNISNDVQRLIATDVIRRERGDRIRARVWKFFYQYEACKDCLDKQRI